MRTNIHELIKNGRAILSPFQADILEECLIKGSGGLSLVMGSGKTLISLILGLEQIKNSEDDAVLIIVSKTLLESWVFEIKKFFKNELKYEVLHQAYNKKINLYKKNKDTCVILTTIDFVTKYYKQEDISNKFITQQIINEGRFNQHMINFYNHPTLPYSNNDIGGAILYSTNWGCMIIDEVQNYTKIETDKCKSLGSICAKNRWVLSGTMFNEPTAQRLLGYNIIIDNKKFPRTLPATELYIKSPLFHGFKETLISRSSNPFFIKPKVNEYIISHNLNEFETKLYMSLKNILQVIKDRLKRYKLLGDTTNTRRFSSYLLAMIVYLRQCLVCPLIPIAGVAIDMSDFQNKSELSELLMEEINKINISKELDDLDCLQSTRITEVMKIINKHKHENIVIFTCFRTCLDIIKDFIPISRKIYDVDSTMSSKQRANVLEEFKKPNKFGNILLLTYDIGSEGLNIQCANTVILVDFYWNSGKTSQAIGRVLRYGQESNEVNLYFLTANTAIEKAIFSKQDLKLQILNELEVGSVKTTIPKIKTADIIKIIETEDNIKSLEKINMRKNYSS